VGEFQVGGCTGPTSISRNEAKSASRRLTAGSPRAVVVLPCFDWPATLPILHGKTRSHASKLEPLPVKPSLSAEHGPTVTSHAVLSSNVAATDDRVLADLQGRLGSH
jgi:hypothetical protein